jgi:hypothetical protein
MIYYKPKSFDKIYSSTSFNSEIDGNLHKKLILKMKLKLLRVSNYLHILQDC